jgi:hypothetical protein
MSKLSARDVRANSDVVRQAKGASSGAHRGHEQARRTYRQTELELAKTGQILGNEDALTIPRCAALAPLMPSPNNFKPSRPQKK